MQAMLKHKQGGVLLVEVLVALALFLAIATIIAQALSVGFVSEKASRSRSVATSVLEELLTEVRASSEEHWSNIASLQKGAPYSLTMVSGHFVATTGSASTTIDGTTYVKSFKIQNALRTIGATTAPLSITGTSSSLTDIGSLIVDSTVTWGSGDTLSLRTVLTRWRNILCGQTSWSTSGPSTVNCETSSVSLGNRNNIETGDKLLLCTGC